MSTMEGMEWRRHMLGAKEIVRQKAMSGLPKGRDTGFICSFMAVWEALSAVTTGETPLLDFLMVSPSPISNKRIIIFFFLLERVFYILIFRNQMMKERNTLSWDP
jgi:hypothetical protein